MKFVLLVIDNSIFVFLKNSSECTWKDTLIALSNN